LEYVLSALLKPLQKRARLYDLPKPHVTEALVCDTGKNSSRRCSKSDPIDARKLAERLYIL